MYGIFGYIYPINVPNVGIYSIHGAYGMWDILHPPNHHEWMGGIINHKKWVVYYCYGYTHVTEIHWGKSIEIHCQSTEINIDLLIGRFTEVGNPIFGKPVDNEVDKYNILSFPHLLNGNLCEYHTHIWFMYPYMVNSHEPHISYRIRIHINLIWYWWLIYNTGNQSW